MSEQRRFDGWDDVDCNDCAHYWDSSCDGVSKGYNKPCNGFLATRSVVIPSQINALKTQIKGLYVALTIEAAAILIMAVILLGKI